MKDAVLFVFLFALYFVLALNWTRAGSGTQVSMLGWAELGYNLVLFFGAATLARWSVMAFKARAAGLMQGQKIVGVEEATADSVIDVVQPKKLTRETEKPKLKRRRRF